MTRRQILEEHKQKDDHYLGGIHWRGGAPVNSYKINTFNDFKNLENCKINNMDKDIEFEMSFKEYPSLYFILLYKKIKKFLCGKRTIKNTKRFKLFCLVK